MGMQRYVLYAVHGGELQFYFLFTCATLEREREDLVSISIFLRVTGLGVKFFLLFPWSSALPFAALMRRLVPFMSVSTGGREGEREREPSWN